MIDDEVKRILEKALDGVTEILKSRRDALVAVAEKLIEVEAINGDDLKRIIEEHATGPQVVPGTEEIAKRKATAPSAEEQAPGEKKQG